MKQVPLLTKEKLSCQYQDADNIAVPIIHNSYGSKCQSLIEDQYSCFFFLVFDINRSVFVTDYNAQHFHLNGHPNFTSFFIIIIAIT